MAKTQPFSFKATYVPVSNRACSALFQFPLVSWYTEHVKNWRKEYGLNLYLLGRVCRSRRLGTVEFGLLMCLPEQP